jgi:TorA maturation chaperone TorD
MERTSENLRRMTVWAFLAEAFRRPSGESPAAGAQAEEAARGLGLPVSEGLRAPRKAELYDILFGHTVRGPCPAYESEYGEPRGMRFSHEIGDLQGFYRAFGVTTSRNLPERADHVAVECEFLAFLALKEACAAELHGAEQADLCRDASAKFLREHLGRFAPALARRLRRKARDPWFLAAAGLLDAMVKRDAEKLGVPVGPEELDLRPDAGTPDDACIACGKAEGTPR